MNSAAHYSTFIPHFHKGFEVHFQRNVHGLIQAALNTTIQHLFTSRMTNIILRLVHTCEKSTNVSASINKIKRLCAPRGNKHKHKHKNSTFCRHVSPTTWLALRMRMSLVWTALTLYMGLGLYFSHKCERGFSFCRTCLSLGLSWKDSPVVSLAQFLAYLKYVLVIRVKSAHIRGKGTIGQ